MRETTLQKIVRVLPMYKYQFTNEHVLQRGIAGALGLHQVRYSREYIASERDRFDFWCEDSVAIEAKIRNSMSAALRQVDRYCELDAVQGVVIVASLKWARTDRPQLELRGKPVVIMQVGRPFV
jgi:hypothetical protein